jgi:DNA-binding CsgD family transcriptional regulator
MFNVEIVDSGRFTPREADVAQKLVEGHSDKVIAKLLGMSIRTVQVHTQKIYEKLQLHNASIAENTAAINSRCYAVALMVARGMVNISLKSLVAVLVFNAAVLDDESLRARQTRVRVRGHLVQVKRGADA